jgi:hypothetical protein
MLVGEVVYGGSAHAGEHQPVVDRTLFDAVQTKLAASANARQLKLKASPSILAGRIFDDRGNRMTPTHANKKGARYRYYISHALLQKRSKEAGSVNRVPAHEVETAVVNAVRAHFDECLADGSETPITERDLIERHVERIVVERRSLQIHLVRRAEPEPSDQEDEAPLENQNGMKSAITVPWVVTPMTRVKGMIRLPSSEPATSQQNRDLLLTAIARARAWIEEVAEGRAASFTEIAEREGKAERHVRSLVSLAFVSLSIIYAIIAGSVGISASDLARTLSRSWTEGAVERQLGKISHL